MGIVSGGGGGGNPTPPVTLTGTNAATIPLAIVGAAAQTQDLLDITARSGDSSNALVVKADGSVQVQAQRGAGVFDVIDQNAGDVFSIAKGGFALFNPSSGASPALQVEYFNNAQTSAVCEFDGIDGASFVNARGSFSTNVHAAPADAAVATGELAFWFDQTNGAAKLMVKAKQANGTVVTAAVALS